MLWLIGLGLADERDITVKGLDVVRNCKRVYLEAYTSTLLVPTERLVRATCQTTGKKGGGGRGLVCSREHALSVRSF